MVNAAQRLQPPSPEEPQGEALIDILGEQLADDGLGPLTLVPDEVIIETLELRYVPLSQAIAWECEGNPKLHDYEQLQALIELNGFRDPPAFDRNLNNGRGGIVFGNGRLQALAQMLRDGRDVPRGIQAQVDTSTGEVTWLVPILFGVDAESLEQAKQFVIDHNASTLGGSDFNGDDLARLFDPELYAGFLAGIDAPLTMTPMEFEDDPDDGGDDGDGDRDPADRDRSAALDVESRVSRGQIWQVGRHRLGCIDSTDRAQLIALLGGPLERVDLVWSDAPYGIALLSQNGSLGKSSLYKPVGGDQDTDVAERSFALLGGLDAVQFWWGANHYASCIPASPCWIIWDKQGGKQVTYADCELCWTNLSSPARIFQHIWDGFRRDSEQGEKRIHPTQKPVALAEHCFGKYGGDRDVILDPFAGSGISFLAAQRMEGDRQVCGAEIDPQYCELILRRLEEAFGLTAELVTTV